VKLENDERKLIMNIISRALKITLLFFLFANSVSAQDNVTAPGLFVLQTNNRVSMWNRTFTSVSADTTMGVNVTKFNTVYLVVAGFDSCSILPSYQLSPDNSKWTTAVSLDSLKISSDVSVQFKTIDISTAVAGAAYVRFILTHSDNAYARGTTTPTYTVGVTTVASSSVSGSAIGDTADVLRGELIPYTDTTSVVAMQWELDFMIETTEARTLINDSSDVLRSEFATPAIVSDTADVLRGEWSTEIEDSINANIIKVNATAGRPAFFGATDSLATYTLTFGLQVDSTLQILNQQVYIAYAMEAVTIDSILTVGGASTANVTMKFWFNDTLWAEASGTAIITSPAATTDEAIGAWQAVDNANVPAGNFIWGTYTDVTTPTNKHVIVIPYKFQ